MQVPMRVPVRVTMRLLMPFADAATSIPMLRRRLPIFPRKIGLFVSELLGQNSLNLDGHAAITMTKFGFSGADAG